jgi:hypothetical protein
MGLLEEITAKLTAMPADERKAIEKMAMDATADMQWIPNPGAQTDAYFSKADILLYGGAGGGGKSDLGLGLAFTAHKRSLILRRRYANLSALTERAVKINGNRDGFNGSPPPLLRTKDGRYIQFGANQHPGDEEDWQGHAFDFKYFDEGTQFLESQIRFHLGWLRPADGENIRCRAVIGSNPPISADGDFIIKMFRPWLDLTHPKPAKPGDLRWFVTAPDGTDLEVDGPKPIQLPGADRPVKPMSRSFIPAKTADNPFLANTDYEAKLDGLPEPLRSAIRDGNFMAMRQDAEWQVIPTEWVVAAQSRWKPDGHKAHDMTVMSLDPAGGGKDSEELIWRHGWWFSEIISAQGEKTSGAQGAAAAIFLNRRDNAPVIVDAGGGYAGAILTRLGDNEVPFERFNGAAAGHGRTKDSNLQFANKRAEAFWRFREALDPSQSGGSEIALPPDAELRADLTAPTYDPRALEQRSLILVEPKENLRKRLGRSPGKADVVVMAWASSSVIRAAKIAHGRHTRPGTYNTTPPGGRWGSRR